MPAFFAKHIRVSRVFLGAEYFRIALDFNASGLSDIEINEYFDYPFSHGEYINSTAEDNAPFDFKRVFEFEYRFPADKMQEYGNAVTREFESVFYNFLIELEGDGSD